MPSPLSKPPQPRPPSPPNPLLRISVVPSKELLEKLAQGWKIVLPN
jgi:hypothetical protein